MNNTLMNNENTRGDYLTDYFNECSSGPRFIKKIKVDSLASLGRNATLITSMAACYPIKIVFHKTSILEWQAAIAEISDLFITRFHCKARMAT